MINQYSIGMYAISISDARYNSTQENMPELKKRIKVLIAIWKVPDIEETHRDLYLSVSQQIFDTVKAIKKSQ